MKNKILKIVEIVLLVILFGVLIFGQKNHELWLDELDWSIGIVNHGNLSEAFETVLKTGENLPLFYIILFFVWKIFGNNVWALTVFSTTIFAILGIIGLIKISDELFGREKRIYTIFLATCSYSLISMCGWQLRPYGLLFCLSSWTLYFYLKKLKDYKSSNFIKYTISMILLMYSHWFGVLICLAYAFFDFILFLKKKFDWKFIIPYIIAGLCFLPSFIILLKFHQKDISSYGVDIPNFLSLIMIFRFMGGELFLNGLILFITICTIIFKTKKNNDIDENKNIFLKIISLMVLLFVIITYIYSRYINPSGSIIRNRYFTVLIPHSIVLISYGLINTVNFMESKKIVKVLDIFLIVLYIILEISFSYTYIVSYSNHEGVSRYKSWVNFLNNQKNIYDDKTLVICTYGKTWIDFYYNNDKLPDNIIAMDPLDCPNGMHMSEVDINKFKYYVKNGKRTSEKFKFSDLKNYDNIYYLEEYRTISNDLLMYFINNYNIHPDITLNVLRMEKKQ